MSPSKTSSLTVLVVDDDQSVRSLMRTILQHQGIRSYEAVSGEDAVRLYQAHREEIDLILLDVQMQGMDGVATLHALQQISSHVRCCFVTGDSGPYTEEDLLREGALRVLHKPFVLSAVQEILTGESGPAFLGTEADTMTADLTRSAEDPTEPRNKDQKKPG